MHQKNVIVRGGALAALMVLAAGAGSVGAEELPLYLTLSQSLTRDSNLLRDNNDRRSDTISVTTVAGGLNKAYGRQNYRVSASASRNAYSDNKQFDNDGYAVSAEVASEVGSNFKVTLNAGASQFLPNFEDQFNRTTRNTERNRQASVDVRYGLYGRWSVNAGASYSKVDYQVTESENKTSKSVFAGVRYLPSDLAYIGLTLYRTDTELPNRRLVTTTAVGEDIERTSLNLDTVWQVTGFSRLSGRLGVTSEKHPQDRRRDFDGLTGSASWTFTPAGKATYALSWVRDTNNEGGGTFNSTAGQLFSANKRLTNSLSATATWQATAKIKLNANYTHAQYEEDSELLLAGVTPVSSDEQTGRYNAVSLGVSYQPLRSVGLGCDMQRYDRTASVFSRAYDGNSVACRASFTID
ncbi:hypothetical protein WIT60_10635 [Aquabacterium sp. G14]|uniref:hypothetical protein n=1 Tax=Aquabacterium sp. G14 TaxID=3130164 RepID=UPI0030A2C02A